MPLESNKSLIFCSYMVHAFNKLKVIKTHRWSGYTVFPSSTGNIMKPAPTPNPNKAAENGTDLTKGHYGYVFQGHYFRKLELLLREMKESNFAKITYFTRPICRAPPLFREIDKHFRIASSHMNMAIATASEVYSWKQCMLVHESCYCSFLGCTGKLIQLQWKQAQITLPSFPVLCWLLVR